MSVARPSLNGHEAYLHALNRTLRVCILASLVVHAALAGLLPSPFHHEHPLPRALMVNLAAAPPPPPPAEPAQPPSLEPPTAVLVAPAARPKPEPARSPTRPQPERKPITAAPTAPEAERALTDVKPEQALTAVPAGETKEEKPAAPAVKAESGDAGPVAPPSFGAGYLRNPEPAYPTASRRLGEEGTVQLRVLVSAEGQPARVDVHRSSGYPRLDEAAAAAVREWRFVPSKRGTTAVEATVIVPIVFRLEAE